MSAKILRFPSAEDVPEQTQLSNETLVERLMFRPWLKEEKDGYITRRIVRPPVRFGERMLSVSEDLDSDSPDKLASFIVQNQRLFRLEKELSILSSCGVDVVPHMSYVELFEEEVTGDLKQEIVIVSEKVVGQVVSEYSPESDKELDELFFNQTSVLDGLDRYIKQKEETRDSPFLADIFSWRQYMIGRSCSMDSVKICLVDLDPIFAALSPKNFDRAKTYIAENLPL